ncbi:DUF2057 family protein [Shewanella sp. 1_MG-2023]|uniref:DUF2057 domain-containing protein n=1 Tax=Shewanella electrodiphila TaxID=934143 RepID=A0ABT0KQ06_9GAMM|nr:MULTISPECIES: DUF2057 family protein [Shewanella]MCC4832925.1 DUF2057 domain-containing protein [Shewanella sp. 10N.7]MCL1045913.1 DUF2057 domain-containing protein [Shewanella electrodiphila]MDO6610939.1 DUF2057 family protein [Shewanella sp. 7_MG-2023]MDO6770210.1 DUF2057 family protein [Shewanella sp. 2_MG-2023]MDO6793351.1 DUF2057 family protein [Shewanella sp. 1_MG-2023]
MNTKLTLSAALGLLLTSFAAQSSSITFHDDLDVDSVNGVVIEFEREVDLGTGEQLIEVSYSDLFQDNADDSGHWVKSQPLYLKLDVSGNEKYHLELPELYSADDAKDFLQNPVLSLTIDGQQHQDITLLSQSQLFTLLLLNK